MVLNPSLIFQGMGLGARTSLRMDVLTESHVTYGCQNFICVMGLRSRAPLKLFPLNA